MSDKESDKKGDKEKAHYKELVGNSGLDVRPEFVGALLGVTRWPPDAFTIEYDDGRLSAVYWIRGTSIGKFAFHEADASSLATIRPLASVSSLGVTSTVPIEGSDRGKRRRILTIRFGSEGEEATTADITVSDMETNPHVAALSRSFIDAVRDAVAGESADN